MQELGKALKVSIYVADGATHRGTATSASLLDFLFYRGVSGATVLKGVAGFGSDHHLHTASLVAVSDRLPVKVEFIEDHAKVEELLPKLKELAGTGMIEVQETTIVKVSGMASDLTEPLPVHHKVEGSAKLLRIYVDEEDQWQDKPLHHALVEALRANEIAGVTVYKGILGFGAGRELHEHTVFADRAPLMLSVIDSEVKIKSFMPILDKMVTNGLAVLSDVDVITYRYGGSKQAMPDKEGHNA
jgi:PII-like signaling protein